MRRVPHTHISLHRETPRGRVQFLIFEHRRIPISFKNFGDAVMGDSPEKKSFADTLQQANIQIKI